MKKLILLIAFVSLNLSVMADPLEEGPIKVEIKKDGDQWQLYRGGEPYYVKGAGGTVRMDLVEAIGGNSVRTWSIDNAKEVLDEAHEHGLTVCMGLWVGHERHGMDYNNSWGIDGQFERFKEGIQEIKDHPALLMWAIGNEVDLFYTNLKVWDAVQDIAKMIHDADPNHPTMTVTAGFDRAEAQLIMERCPDIDILGVNTYGGVEAVPAQIRQSGWPGAYMITEWGPTGHWEVAKTLWNAPIEQTSAEKADVYKNRYMDAIHKDAEKCVGSYVFVWGQKQETTATWYGMFTEDGKLTETIDVMEYLWSGEWPKNRTPRLESLKINDKGAYDNLYVKPGQECKAVVKIEDPDGDTMEMDWQIVPESTDIKSGGDAEAKPEAIAGLIKSEQGKEMIFKAPRAKGAYRLFLFVYDGNEHAAYANIPFYVK